MEKMPLSLSSPAVGELEAAFGERLRRGEALKRHTSARIGGPADLFLKANTLEDLKLAATIAWSHSLPLFILGGGSNLLVASAGIRGLVVVNRARRVTFDGLTVCAASGANFSTVAQRCINEGLAGLEWAIGVPGTVGGAVVGNAGAHGGDVATYLESATIFQPDGVARGWSSHELAFDYRTSIVKRSIPKSVILDATFVLSAEPVEEIRARARQYNAHRKATQPPGATIGSMFKNPPGDYAGRLIEQVGLKGWQVGNAQISLVHANFFVNLGDAHAEDVRVLIDLAREKVLAELGVELALEVQLVGDWSSAKH